MSKEPKFKAGDRVCCYGQDQQGSFDAVNEEGDTGTVTGACGSESIAVSMDNNYFKKIFIFHPKQCRLLKLKKPRRRIWVNEYDGGLDAFQHPLESCADRASGPARSACIEFIEVRRKK